MKTTESFDETQIKDEDRKEREFILAKGEIDYEEEE